MLGDGFCTLTVDLSSMYADLRHRLTLRYLYIALVLFDRARSIIPV